LFAISALDFFCLGIAVASTISPGRKDDLAAATELSKKVQACSKNSN
jgi:hypothetical protein